MQIDRKQCTTTVIKPVGNFATYLQLTLDGIQKCNYVFVFPHRSQMVVKVTLSCCGVMDNDSESWVFDIYGIDSNCMGKDPSRIRKPTMSEVGIISV